MRRSRCSGRRQRPAHRLAACPSCWAATGGHGRPARLPAPLRPHRRRPRGRGRAVQRAADQGRRPDPPPAAGAGEIVRKKTVCTHCSVGCTVIAEVQNGVWVGQEPALRQPVQPRLALRQGRRDPRARPWRPPHQVPDEAGRRQMAADRLGRRRSRRSAASCWRSARRPGPNSVYWLGSAKYSNEQAYLFRKFAAFWGTNNVDHQARICHSTTVAGVANTWGYGAMTNSYNDIHNSKADLPDRRQPGRGAPGLAAPSAQGQGGERRAPDRLRPALHPHRRPRRRVCPPPLRHRRRR